MDFRRKVAYAALGCFCTLIGGIFVHISPIGAVGDISSFDLLHCKTLVVGENESDMKVVISAVGNEGLISLADSKGRNRVMILGAGIFSLFDKQDKTIVTLSTHEKNQIAVGEPGKQISIMRPHGLSVHKKDSSLAEIGVSGNDGVLKLVNKNGKSRVFVSSEK